MKEFTSPVRVYIEDTDAGGIVYYVNYLKFMERGRTEFMRSLGFDKPALLEGNKLLVVHSLTSSYKKPARLDDLLQVSAKVTRLTRTSLIIQQQVTLNGELMCEADIKLACVAQDTMKPVPIPDNMHAAVMAAMVD